MPDYTMRRTWPDDAERQSDFVFRVDGRDAGRCYFMRDAGNRDVWRWTVYGISSGGIEDTLQEAQRRFKDTYERAALAPAG